MSDSENNLNIMKGWIGFGDIWLDNRRLIMNAEYECSLLCEKRMRQELPGGEQTLAKALTERMAGQLPEILKQTRGKEPCLSQQITACAGKEMTLMGFDLIRFSLNVFWEEA